METQAIGIESLKELDGLLVTNTTSKNQEDRETQRRRHMLSKHYRTCQTALRVTWLT